MSIPGGVISFFGNLGNRPDENPNTQTQRISAPEQSSYGVYNPNAGTGNIDQIRDQYHKAQSDYNQLNQMAQQFSRIGDTASAQKYSQMAQQVKQKGLGLLAQRDRVLGANNAENVAKGYESRQIDPGAYNLMKSAAEGSQPSQAELMMKRQAGQLFNQSLSAANSARTYNPALARAAMFSNASGQADLMQRLGEVRAGEMAQARNAFGQYGLSQQSQNDAMANQARGVNLGYAQMNQHGAIQGQQDLMKSQALNQADDQWRRSFKYGAQNARNQANKEMWGGVAKTFDDEDKKAQDAAGGMLGIFSDARTKKNIQPVGSLTDQFASVTPVAYDYKPRYGGGSEVGVVAQDIEQTPVGKLIVGSKSVDGKKMKTINQPAAVSTLLATAAEQAKRIKQLEARTGGVDIGQAQINPQYDVQFGRAQIHPSIEIGPATNIRRTEPAYDPRQQESGPLIPAPPGVRIDSSGSTVLVDENVPPPQFFGPQRYQGQPLLNATERKNFLSQVGVENRHMTRNPAMQLFEQNPPYATSSEGRYGREMLQLAARQRRRGGVL